jgi:hypothetical protein
MMRHTADSISAFEKRVLYSDDISIHDIIEFFSSMRSLLFKHELDEFLLDYIVENGDKSEECMCDLYSIALDAWKGKKDD